jgi:hypothetical protein
MRHFNCYGDDRNKGFCVHCGGANETKDHIPSRVLLDEPLPANVAVSPACFNCNNGLSIDEEYLACLLECVVSGDVDAEKVERPKIAHILRTNAPLAKRLRNARRVIGEQVMWDFEHDRIQKVLLKLARGHAAHELNEPRLEEPDVFYFRPLCTMSESERQDFEQELDAGPFALWPEVGSRAMNRLLIAGPEVSRRAGLSFKTTGIAIGLRSTQDFGSAWCFASISLAKRRGSEPAQSSGFWIPIGDIIAFQESGAERPRANS